MKTTAWISMAIAMGVLASQPAAADPEARNHPRQKSSAVLAKKHVPAEKPPAAERPAPLPGRGDIKKPVLKQPNPQR